MRNQLLASFLGLCFVTHACFTQEQRPDSAQTSGSSAVKTCAIVGGSTVVTLLLIRCDQQTYDVIHGWKENNPAIKTMSPIITEGGNGTVSAVMFGGIGAYSLIFKDTKGLEIAKIGLESFLLTGIACQMLKYTFSRERPSAATESGGAWSKPFSYFSKAAKGKSIASYDSFPSGHTTTAFSWATTFADAYPDTWVPYASYSMATLVGISRIMESTHWLSDCFAGALLGHYGTNLIEYLNYGSTSIQVSPRAGTSGYGLTLTATF